VNEPNQEKTLSRAYLSPLRQAKARVDDYEHLAPDADYNIDPVRKRRIARMRETIRQVEELRKAEMRQHWGHTGHPPE